MKKTIKAPAVGMKVQDLRTDTGTVESLLEQYAEGVRGLGEYGDRPEEMKGEIVRLTNLRLLALGLRNHYLKETISAIRAESPSLKN